MKIAWPGGRWAFLLPALAVAAYLALFGDKTPSGAAKVASPTARPEPVSADAPRAQHAARGRPAAPPESIERVVSRTELLSAAFAPSTDLFSSPQWSAKPPPPPPTPAQPVPQPVPVAVPNYRVLGKKLENDAWEVYLGRDDTSLIARAGDTLDNTWRIETIDPPTLTMTHVPTGQSQTLAIGDPR